MSTGGKITSESQVKSIGTNCLSDRSTLGACNMEPLWKCGVTWELQIYHHLNRHYDTLTADQGLCDYSNHCCLFSDETIGISTSCLNNVRVLAKHRVDHGNATFVKEKNMQSSVAKISSFTKFMWAKTINETKTLEVNVWFLLSVQHWIIFQLLHRCDTELGWNPSTGWASSILTSSCTCSVPKP